MSSQVAKQENSRQMDRTTGQAQRLRQTDEHEVEAKASASAGLNLNLVGMVSGIFTGKKNKTTDTDADGKSHSVEKSRGRGYMTGSGVADLGVIGTGEATTTERQRRTIEGTQEQFDHLGTSERQAIEAGSAKK